MSSLIYFCDKQLCALCARYTAYTACVHELYIKMMPLQNKHVEVLDEMFGSDFKELFVEQIVKARDSIFEEMCQEMNVNDFQNVRAVNMTKKTVTKEKLCGWLETVCCILDTFSVPLLSSAVPLAKRVEKLKDEKICDQKSIIDLQKKVIEISQEGLKAVQTTVQTEMKSYSSVLSNNYAAALAPRKIQAAVRKVVDRED